MSKKKIIEKKPFKSWQTYCNRYVAVFDVISLINYKGPAAPSAVEIFERLLQLSDAGENVERMRGVNQGVAHENNASGQLKYFQFANTVALVSVDNSRESLIAIELASLALFLNAFMVGLPTRGAIALGEAIVDIGKNICIGKAVDWASKRLEDQNWLGVIYHHTMQSKEPSDEYIREATEEDIPITVYTKVPMFNESQEETKLQVLNWPVFIGTSADALKQLNKIKYTLGLESTSVYYNTARFISERLS